MKTLLLFFLCIVHPTLWQSCQFTVYADQFDGRTMANGQTFRHSGNTIASRSLKLGTRVILAYRQPSGRLAYARATVSDTGRLPLDRPGCPQFDVSRHLARELGLYRIERGATARGGCGIGLARLVCRKWR